MNDKLDFHHGAAKAATRALRDDIRQQQGVLTEMKIVLVRQSNLDEREKALTRREDYFEETQKARAIKREADDVEAQNEQVKRDEEREDRAKRREQSIRDQEARIREKEAYIDEMKEALEKMEVLQVQNTRRTDMENDPQLRRYLESIIPDITSTIGTVEMENLEDDCTKNVTFQAEIDRDNLLMDLRKTWEQKIESDTIFAETLEAKMKVDADLEHTHATAEKKRRRGFLVRISGPSATHLVPQDHY